MTSRWDHIAPEDWVDLVRNVASDEQRSRIEGHLAEGCQTCAHVHRDWLSFCETASKDSSYEPPESAVRLARALFSVQPAPGRLAQVFESIKVLFDSDLLPAPAGVRSAGTPKRKILFATGEFFVDVQLETSRDTNRTTVIGQLVGPDQHSATTEGVPVLLLCDMRVVGKGITNRLGEFSMEFEGSAGNLSVALGLKEKGTVVQLGAPRLVQS